MSAHTNKKTLLAMYRAMHERLGPSRWWPGDTPFEIAVGAVLTQNTAWTNVDKALSMLREKNALHPAVMWEMPEAELRDAIRPSGYYSVKARRLRNLLEWLLAFDGWKEPDAPSFSYIKRHFPDNSPALRDNLLRINGIGPETADCIVLYSFGHPTFVADAYARRIFSRHALVKDTIKYEDLRAFFMRSLPGDVDLFNEYHALIVRTGHAFCKKSAPLCGECPLGHFPFEMLA